MRTSRRISRSPITIRGHTALVVGAAAQWASRATDRGEGGVIGGRVAMWLDRSILRQLGTGRRTVIVTGTNGKSTTTKMVSVALATLGSVSTNAGGANMDAGLVTALAGTRSAELAALEVDEMHVPHIAAALDPTVIVLLNLSRDQLDRIGETHRIEQALRLSLARHPKALIVANCDDVLITSVAYDCPNVLWIAAGGDWANDSVACPRSSGMIIRESGHWHSTGADFKRPSPEWWFDSSTLFGPAGLSVPMLLSLPGAVNRGNAAQAVVAAIALGADLVAATTAVAQVNEVAGRYQTVRIGDHTARILLAKNPVGWLHALSMVNKTAEGLVIAVNGRTPDGLDLSWLWDVNFEHLENVPVVVTGERGADLMVRLAYAGVPYQSACGIIEAVLSCPKGHVEVIVNYSAFMQLKKTLRRMHG